MLKVITIFYFIKTNTQYCCFLISQQNWGESKIILNGNMGVQMAYQKQKVKRRSEQ